MNGGTNQNTKSLLEWVLALHPDTPKTRAKQWILAGRVSVRGEVIRKPQTLLESPGETLQLMDRRSTTLDCGSGWLIHPRVSLLYLDSALAVVNKGAGLVSVPAANAELSALSILQDFLAGRIRAADRAPGSRTLPPVFRAMELLPVHRLDQYTTGLLCIACNPIARARLIAQLKEHRIHREYVAFVEGRPSETRGTWRDFLSLSPDELQQRVVTAASSESSSSRTQEAVTHYEVLETYSVANSGRFVTKLKIRLETGLKHQIRIQAAKAGLPLVGERKYHPDYLKGTGRLVDFTRQALHALFLGLEHPEQPEKHLSWHAPLPKDLRELEHELRQGRTVSDTPNPKMAKK
jgi:23S rRNA pseudouridine1911/1915/1917 synthase